ncbi:MAG: two pore domain potassium channel family protein [Rhizobiales bacterium]|nr:two pore domain potassium channel family protein [Hyphomicrobiales bacterium]MBI3673209.1 two pore domain potassium channel family protein [Hyphomicrobiales bacterium]
MRWFGRLPGEGPAAGHEEGYVLIATLIVLVMCVVTVMIHMEGLWYMRRYMRWFVDRPRVGLVLIVMLLLSLHVVEIAFYALGYMAADLVFHVGQFADEKNLDTFAYFYYSAVTFTAVGYGDILPVGETRLIAAGEALNGLTLISWSGAFTFIAMQKVWSDRISEIREEQQLKREARIAGRQQGGGKNGKGGGKKAAG